MNIAEYRQLLFNLKKEPKYRNQRVLIDGHNFMSIKEGNRYCELKLLVRCDSIHSLELQPKFILKPKTEKSRAITYIADFKYYCNERKRWIVEDVKGCLTEVYKLKKKMFLDIYGDEYLFVEII